VPIVLYKKKEHCSSSIKRAVVGLEIHYYSNLTCNGRTIAGGGLVE